MNAYAAPAWPLVALDALRPVADDTPPPADGVLPGVAPVLDDISPRAAAVAPVLSDTPPPAAGVLPGVAPVLDDTSSSTAGVLPGIGRSVRRARLTDPPCWSYSSLLGQPPFPQK